MKTPRLGYLSSTAPNSRTVEAFRAGLADWGYVEGQNVAVEWRFADNDLERLPELAAELVRLPVDVILAGSSPAIGAAQQATTTLPIVMGVSADPLEQGFVESLARPGRNITGLTSISNELTGKRLEMLLEAVPAASRIAVLWNPANPAKHLEWRDAQTAAEHLRVELVSAEARAPAEFARAFEQIAAARADAILVLGDQLMTAQQARIDEFSVQSRRPAIYETRESVLAGGLMAYGPNRDDLFRRSAYYVARILQGAQPGELPVERPSRFYLVIGRRATQALGLTLSPAMLLDAEVID
jgi:putative tryptophan/tyrosine transport system substrate-binding protein